MRRTSTAAPATVLQRLHRIFAGEVNLDLDAVTTHLAARGLETPRLVRTLDGRAWIDHGGAVWRATTWVDGESVATVPDASWAETGGALVGTFHRAMGGFAYRYQFARAGIHDTQKHLARLRELAVDQTDASDLGREILAAAATLPTMPVLPARHVHGDLKISNLLFRRTLIEPHSHSGVLPPGGEPRSSARAVALVDLDTLGMGTMAFELGDAMRSWCNPHGEDAGHVHFELGIFAAAIAGFRAVADSLVTRDERLGIAIGLETVCVELAARFAIDVFEDRYFGWDPSRFASRRDHNLVRARGQLALALEVRAAHAEIADIVLAGS